MIARMSANPEELIEIKKPVAEMPRPAATVGVWDAGLRLFHWLFALSVTAALGLGFLAPKTLLDYHVYAGYGAGLLLLLRVVWGFTGPTFARFGSFLYSPRRTLAYVRGEAPSGLGHNPLGALMVFALLASVAVLVASGLIVLGGVEKQGLLAPITGFETGSAAREVHKLVALAVVAMIVLHLGGVVFESVREKENLARSMITGRKRMRLDPTARVAARPATAFTALAILAVAVLPGALTLASLPPAGVHPLDMPVAYKEECGACHMPYHPSLLPAQAWTTLMAGLGDHFGEDASLDPATVEEIRNWLVANAAEQWDTKAAHWFAARDPADPLRITATPRWKQIHRHIAPAVFASPEVGGKGNCAACHGDAASGLFAPQKIHIPETRTESPAS